MNPKRSCLNLKMRHSTQSLEKLNLIISLSVNLSNIKLNVLNIHLIKQLTHVGHTRHSLMTCLFTYSGYALLLSKEKFQRYLSGRDTGSFGFFLLFHPLKQTNEQTKPLHSAEVWMALGQCSADKVKGQNIGHTVY